MEDSICQGCTKLRFNLAGLYQVSMCFLYSNFGPSLSGIFNLAGLYQGSLRFHYLNFGHSLSGRFNLAGLNQVSLHFRYSHFGKREKEKVN